MRTVGPDEGEVEYLVVVADDGVDQAQVRHVELHQVQVGGGAVDRGALGSHLRYLWAEGDLLDLLGRLQVPHHQSILRSQNNLGR